jgi:PIN domain nuclease of toxin-antitoxin system
MRLLLDTHTVLWFLDDVKKLSDTALRAIIDPSNEKYVSVATAWELAIKISLQKLRFNGGAANFFKAVEENGFRMIAVRREYVEIVESLPFHHRDPFDRMLVATAILANMTIITTDAAIRAYDVDCVW